MGWRHHDSGIPHPRCEHVGRPPHRLPAVADRQQRTRQGPDHVVAERVGDDGPCDHAGLLPLPLEPEKFPDRARARPAPAERGEVMLAEAGRSGFVHQVNLNRPPVPERVVPAERISACLAVTYPVGVPAPECGEPRIKFGRHGADRADAHIRRENAVQPPQCGLGGCGPDLLRNIEVGHLTTGVHASVGPPSHGQRRQLRHPQDASQRGLDVLLHRTYTGLGGPAVEPRTVVREIDPEPDKAVPASGAPFDADAGDGAGAGV